MADNVNIRKEAFIKNAVEKHGDKYNYDLVEYLGNKIKVKIKCNTCEDIFEQRPNDHVSNGAGCKKCSIKIRSNKLRKSLDVLLEEFKNIHGEDKYDYSQVEYINDDTKIKIYCKTCRKYFMQSPYWHRKGNCPTCAVKISHDKVKTPNLEFINRSKFVFGDKFDYSKTIYKSLHENVIIICKKHNFEYEQEASSHLRSIYGGCQKCETEQTTIDKKFTTEIFIEKSKELFGDIFEYDKVNYTVAHGKLTITCKKHGDFIQSAYSHLAGRNGCRRCVNKVSKGEKDVLEFIQSIYNGQIEVNVRNIISPYELDIYLPELNLAIEYNGLYWHSELEKEKEFHKMKTEMCEEKGIQLIHIYEDDWQYKQDIIKSRISNKLGLTQNKVYARQCDIREIDSKISDDFCDDNHIQGKSLGSSVRIGLYRNGELVSVMTFKKSHKGLNEYELSRFCNKLNYSVVGGADRLFKDFIKNHKPQLIETYADRSWSSLVKSTIYDKLGFKYIDNTDCGYSYIIDGIRINRRHFTKQKLIDEGYDSSKTESEIMNERGYFKIFDSGHLIYKWKRV